MTVELSAQTARLAVMPAPAGKPGGPGLWRVKGMALPPYFENIRNALIRGGKTPEAAYKITWGAIRRWARGGGKVHPEVVAAAQAALADLAAESARARADHANDTEAVELTWNAALHPRVAAGASTGGQFGTASAGTAKAGTPAKGKPAAKAAPKKAPAKPAARPPVSPAQLQANRAKAAKLHAQAKADRAKAKALLGQVSQINAQITANQAAAAKAAKAAKAKAKNATAKAATNAPAKHAKASSKPGGKKKAAKRMTTAQLKAKRATLRAQAAGLMAKAKALDAQASHLKLAGDRAAVELAVKTPMPERAAGRKKLAAKGHALAGGTAPIPDVAYLKKAIRAKGRVDPAKWPALKRLIRKRARELKATNAPGVKGTWAFQGANGSDGIELAMTMKTPRVRGPGDVSCKRTGPGEVTVTHKPTGMRIGTLKSAQHGGWQGMHATGKPSPASGSMTGALSGLIGVHNKVAASMPSAEPAGGVRVMAAHEAALELSGSLPYTSGATSSDGPRVTTMGGAGNARVKGGAVPDEVRAIYRKLIAKGMKPMQAMALAKRAAAMHAKAAAKAA